MSHALHYKISILGALVSSIAFTALAVFAIAPADTLDPVVTHPADCPNGPTDPGCIINPYENLDPDSILFLDNARDISTSANLFWDNVDGRMGIGTNTPGAQLQINTTGDSTIGQIIRAYSPTQTANLQEWQDSTGAVKLSIDQYGSFYQSESTLFAESTTDPHDVESEIFSIKSFPTMQLNPNASPSGSSFVGSQFSPVLDVTGARTSGTSYVYGTTNILYTDSDEDQDMTYMDLRGNYGYVDHQGNVTLGTASGVTGRVINGGNGNITNARSLWARSVRNDGTGIIGTTYGLYLDNQTTGTDNYSIYSAGGKSYFAGTIGIGTTNPNQGKLEVKGGTVCVDTNSDDDASSCITTESDRRIKNIIGDTEYGIDDLMNVQVYDFSYTTDPLSRTRTGVIAQELYDIFPDVVEKGDNGETLSDDSIVWTVDYSRLSPMIIRAVQDLHIQVQSIENSFSEQNSFVDNIIAWLGDMTNGIQNIFTKRLTTEELCVEDICVTRDQFLQMIENSNTSFDQNQIDDVSGEESIPEENDETDLLEDEEGEIIVDENEANQDEEIILDEESPEVEQESQEEIQNNPEENPSDAVGEETPGPPQE